MQNLKKTLHFALCTFNSQCGQSLVELLVAIALTAVLLPALITGLVSSREGKAQQDQRLQAVAYLKEAQEATRSIRENGWALFATAGTYHPVASGSAWMFASGAEVLNGFTRQVVISDVLRNSAGAIVQSGGTLDPSTKQAVASISWGTPIASTISSTLYFTRYLNNVLLTDTTQADFNAGTKTGVTVTNTSGGEVQLGAGGGGDWCNPNLSISALDLPGQGITTAISAVVGHAYTTTGGNSSGDSMDSVTITDPPLPAQPAATVAGSYNNFKTYTIYTDGSYAYLTSDHPGLTVDIVQVTTLPYTQVGTFNASGTGNGIYVANNVGYVTVGNRLYTFDLSSKNGARAQLGSVTLAGTAQNVVVQGSYAYVTISGSVVALEVINVTNPRVPFVTAVGQISFVQNAKGLYVNSTGTRAYLALTSSFSFFPGGFFIIDTSNKIGVLPTVSSYNTNGMDPRGIAVVPGNRAIVVGSGGEQYQVIDISNETSPIRCGGLTNPNGASSVNAVAGILEPDGDAFSYILTDNSSKEFQMIAGGPGGQFSTSGNFESRTFFSTSSAALNRFFATASIPGQTSLSFQFTGAPVNQSTGNCNAVTFSYIGPDGTSNTYFATTSAALPFGFSGFSNPAQCIRYKAFFSTTDQTQSPVLYDMNINYSP